MASNILETWMTTVWPIISTYLQSAAQFLPVVVPLSAAFFGAYTAQRIAERNRSREDLTKEIRNTNAALAVAFTVCNSAIALKRQHVSRIAKEFAESKAAFEQHLFKRKTGQIQGDVVYRFLIHLMTVNTPKFATDSLRSMVLDRLSAVGRPLHLAVEIADSADRLNACIVARNTHIEKMKTQPGENFLAEDGSAQRFFGLEFGGGHQDLTFPHLMDAITRSTDDVIFFANLLCEDLRKHGDKLVKKYCARFGNADTPRIIEIDFSDRVADETIPPRREYQDWFDKFLERSPPPSLWQRIRHPLANRGKGKIAQTPTL